MMADDLTYICTLNRVHLLDLDLGKGLWQFLKKKWGSVSNVL